MEKDKKIINTNLGITIILMFSVICVLVDFIYINSSLDSYVVNSEVKKDDESLEKQELEFVRNNSLEIDSCFSDMKYNIEIKDGNIILLDNYVYVNGVVRNLVIDSVNAKYLYLKGGSHCTSNYLFYITEDNKLYMLKYPLEYIEDKLANVVSDSINVSELIEQNKLILLAENAVDFVENDSNSVIKYIDVNDDIKEYNFYSESLKEEEFIFIGKQLHKKAAAIYFSNGSDHYILSDDGNFYAVESADAIYTRIDEEIFRLIFTDFGFTNYCSAFNVIKNNGYYYRLLGERGSNIFYYKTEFEIIEMTNLNVKFKANSYYVKDFDNLDKSFYEENELEVITYDFIIEKEDGMWKVSQFIMPY